MKTLFESITGKAFKAQEGDDASLLRKKQKLSLAVVVLGIGGFFWFVKSGVKKASDPIAPIERPKSVVLGELVDEKETWVSRLESQADKMEKVLSSFKTQNDIQEKRLANLENALTSQEKAKKDAPLSGQGSSPGPQETITSAPLNAAGLQTMNEQKQNFGQGLKSPPTDFLGESTGEGFTIKAPVNKILHFSVSSENEFHHAKDYVVSGTYAKAVLTSGVVVSTAIQTQGNPQPIMMRLADHGNLPRGWKSRLKDAVLIGSCYGDLSSERAVCRIHTLSFVERTGRTIEKDVEGWLIGEDGAPGLRGKVIDRAGKVVREAFVAGILSGMSSFLKFEAQSSVYPISPFGQSNAMKPQDALQSGLGKGGSNALEKLADFSIKRAEAMQPVLVVNPGCIVDVVFKKGFDLNPSPSLTRPGSLKPVSISSEAENPQHNSQPQNSFGSH
jgi:conjugal transfer pilus assembly protein TraB